MITILKYSFLFFIAVVICNTISAQQSYQPEYTSPFTESWRWRHFPELNGKGFADMQKAADGTMWFAIEKGLMSYDGYQWKEYLCDSNIHLSIINEILVDDTIYLGTKSGLIGFHENKWFKIISIAPKKTVEINSLNKLSDGSIVACADSCLFILKNNNICGYTSAHLMPALASKYKGIDFQILDYDFGDQPIYFRDIIEFKNEVLVFMQQPKMSPMVLEGKLSGNINSPIAFMPIKQSFQKHQQISFGQYTYSALVNNKVWVVSQSVPRGISVYDGKTWTNFLLSSMFNYRNHQSGVVQLKDSTIIVAGQGMLYSLKNNKWSVFAKPDIPVPSNVYLRIEETKEGNLWVGGVRSEVYYIEFNKNRWQTFKNLSFQFENKEGEKWFLSADNKVVINKNNNWSYFDQDDGIIDYPLKLVNAPNGDVYCVGSHQEVSAASVYYNYKWKKFLFDSLSWGVEKRSTYVHTDSSVWIGSPSGSRRAPPFHQYNGIIKIKRIADDKFTYKRTYNLLGVIGGFGRSKDGYVYSTDFFATYRYTSDGNFELYPSVRGKKSRLISTPKGNLWLGTEDFGIYKFNGDSYTNYNFNDGLLSNTIVDLYAETDSTLWIATEKDITFFDGETFINHALPDMFILEKRGGNFEKGIDNNFWVNVHSKRWTLRSYNREFDYKPDNDFYAVLVKPDTNRPIVNVTLLNKQITTNDFTTISWQGKDYYDQTKLKYLVYSYKIGNSNWSNYNTETSHIIKSLPVGKHLVQVKVKDQFGNTSTNKGITILHVVPPVYFRLWFIILITVFLSIIAYLASRIIVRNNKLEKQKVEILLQNDLLLSQEKDTHQLNEELKVINNQLHNQNSALEKAMADLKKTQLQLIQSEKMASIGILTAGVAHEINNPLNFIMGGKHAIEDYINENLSEHKNNITPLMEIIQSGIERASEIVKSLNRFNRTTESIAEHCDIHDIIQNCIIMIRNQTKDKINITLDFTTVPVVIVGNEGKLYQVIMNILINAIHAIKNEGSIDIATSYLESEVEISISDNGEGIKQEDLDRIMDPFFTTKDPGEGTGLGLSISYAIVKEHKGNLKFLSEPGKGTKAIITLPIKGQSNNSNE